MVKLYAPCLSLDASGTIGNAIVFSKWKGRAYARERVIPANPKSGPQTGIRAMMKFLAQNWQNLTSVEQADWQTRGDQLVASPFNAFVSYNLTRWRNFLGPSQLDPATEVAVSAGLANITSTAGVRQVTLSADSNGAGDPWGIIWFHSLTAIFTMAWSNVIAIIPAEAADTFTYVHSPLAAGEHFYNQGVINASGLRAAADFEHSAVVA